MLVGRDGQGGVRKGGVLVQAFRVARLDESADRAIEGDEPRHGGRRAPREEERDVVDDAPASDEDDAVVAERCERASELLDEPRRARHREGDLEHGVGRSGEEMEQRDPDAVVEAARRVEGRVEAVRAQALHDPLGEGRRARAAVGDLVEGPREPAEVVDRRRRGMARDADRPTALEVRRDHDDGGRRRERLADAAEGLRVVVPCERLHGRAVVEEEDGGAGHAVGVARDVARCIPSGHPGAGPASRGRERRRRRDGAAPRW